MIGHVFASSGATCLALAPSAERPDEYIVLARTENGYAVATLLTEALGREGGPDSWLRANYFDRLRGNEDDRWDAAVAFTDATLGDTVASLDDATLTAFVNRLVAAIEHAEQVTEHRGHLARASG